MIQRHLDISEKYPNMIRTNINILQSYYDTNLSSIITDDRYNREVRCFNILCMLIDSPMTPDFKEWDTYFVWNCFKGVKINNPKRIRIAEMVRDILIQARCVNDITKVIAPIYPEGHITDSSNSESVFGDMCSSNPENVNDAITIGKRYFDVSSKYPLISNDNTKAIQAFCSKAAIKPMSEESYNKIIQNINYICGKVNSTDVTPFEQWSLDTIQEYFGDMSYSYNKISRILKIIKEILHIAGCRSDFSKLSASSFLENYRSGLYSFEILNNIMKREFYKSRPHLSWDVMNDVSTTVVICYLEWIGFSREEISQLKLQDYNTKAGVIIYNSNSVEKRKIIPEEEIEQYLLEYVSSHSYLQYNSKYGKKICRYGKGNTLVKSAYDSTKITKSVIDNYLLKVPTIFGISANDIWMSGRLNEMYALDKTKNVRIALDNIEDISYRLGLNIPKFNNNLDSTVGRLIMMYDSYRKGRDIIYTKNT